MKKIIENDGYMQISKELIEIAYRDAQYELLCPVINENVKDYRLRWFSIRDGYYPLYLTAKNQTSFVTEYGRSYCEEFIKLFEYRDKLCQEYMGNGDPNYKLRGFNTPWE